MDNSQGNTLGQASVHDAAKLSRYNGNTSQPGNTQHKGIKIFFMISE